MSGQQTKAGGAAGGNGPEQGTRMASRAVGPEGGAQSARSVPATDGDAGSPTLGRRLGPGCPRSVQIALAGTAYGALTLVPVGRFPLGRAVLGGAVLGATGLAAAGAVAEARRRRGLDVAPAPAGEDAAAEADRADAGAAHGPGGRERGPVATGVRVAAVGAAIGAVVATAIVLPDRIVEKAVARVGVRRPRLVMAGAAVVFGAVEEAFEGRGPGPADSSQG